MKEIYWITRLDYVCGCCNAFLGVSAAITVVMIIAIISAALNEEEGLSKKLRKWIILPITFIVINILGVIFIPTTKEAFTVLGIGGTIEYMQDNETLKELPDKCVKALDMWVESLIEEK